MASGDPGGVAAEQADLQVRRGWPDREHRLGAGQLHGDPAGAVVRPLGVHELLTARRRARPRPPAGSTRRPGRCAASSAPGRPGLRGAPERYQAGWAFLHDHVAPGGRAARLQPGVRGAEGRVPGERKLLHRGEDPHPVVRPLVGRRQQERGLRQVGPAGEQPHLLVGEPVRPVHDRHRVANEWLFGEHVDLSELPVHAVHHRPGPDEDIPVIDARRRRT